MLLSLYHSGFNSGSTSNVWCPNFLSKLLNITWISNCSFFLKSTLFFTNGDLRYCRIVVLLNPNRFWQRLMTMLIIVWCNSIVVPLEDHSSFSLSQRDVSFAMIIMYCVFEKQTKSFSYRFFMLKIIIFKRLARQVFVYTLSQQNIIPLTDLAYSRDPGSDSTARVVLSMEKKHIYDYIDIILVR